MGVEKEWEEMRKRIGEEEEEEEEEGEEGGEEGEEGEEEGGEEGRMVEVVEVKWDEEGKSWMEEETKVRCGKKAVESPWEGGRKSCANVTEGGKVVMLMKQGGVGEIVGGEFVIAKEYLGLVKEGEGEGETFAELVKGVVNSRKEAGSHGRMLSAYYMLNMDGFASEGERYQKAKELKNWVTDRFGSCEVVKGEGRVKKEGKRFVYDFFRSGFSLRVGDKCLYNKEEYEVRKVDYEKCEAKVKDEKGDKYVIGLNLLEIKDFVLKKGVEERRKVLNFFHSEEKDGKQGKKNHEAFFYYAFYRHLCKDVKGRMIADFLTRGRREEIETPSYLEYVLLSFVRKLFSNLKWGGDGGDLKTEQRIKKYIYIVVLSALMKSVFNDLNRKYSEYYGEKPKKSIDKLIEELESPKANKSPSRRYKTSGKGGKKRKSGGGGGNRKRAKSSLPPTPSKIDHNEITRMQMKSDDYDEGEEENFEIITTLIQLKESQM